MTNVMWINEVSHALRLRHIDLLRKTIEKDIVNIKLVNSPLVIECKAKHSTDDDGIYHGTEILLKIYA